MRRSLRLQKMLLQLSIKQQTDSDKKISIDENISIVVKVVGYIEVNEDDEYKEWVLDHRFVRYHALPVANPTRAALSYTGDCYSLNIEAYNGEDDEDYPHFQLSVSDVKEVSNFPVPA
jgi:hypothetical protein